MSTAAEPAAPVVESYFERYGLPNVTIAEALWQIELSIVQNQTRGVWCLVSEAGEGKSQGIHQLARKHNRRVVDIRTSQFSMIGAGVPQRADASGHFKIAIPDDFPREGEKCILLFDEINQGQPHALALFFKLIEDRCLYSYRLPDDCIVIALMNPSTGSYAVTKIESNAAFNRRLQKLYVHSTFTDWKKHAQTEDFHYTDGMKKPCHPMVVRLLTASPSMLYTAKDRERSLQFACPATWQTVSLSLYNLAAAGEDLTSERTETRIAASINTVNAKMLVEFIRNNEILIGPEEILFKYKPKSKLRDRVIELQKEAGGDYIRLVQDVAQYLFRERPEPDIVAPQLVQFWADLPMEQSQPMYQMLDVACSAHGGLQDPKNMNYMKALTIACNQHPLWREINEKINRVHDTTEKKLKGETKGKDPMVTT
jgi:hypothetical protein